MLGDGAQWDLQLLGGVAMIPSLLSALFALPVWLLYLFVGSLMAVIAGVVLLVATSRMHD